MAQLSTKVKLYIEANSKTWDNSKVELRNKGSGDFIAVWKYDDLTKPTDSQLNALEAEATKSDNNNIIGFTRKKSYGDIGEQLDEIYKDIDAWRARIKSIKDANPKE
tara:strand:+ start:609 stop:929 length:321 start_codon:yes stop_codon:yes gene_type:complete